MRVVMIIAKITLQYNGGLSMHLIILEISRAPQAYVKMNVNDETVFVVVILVNSRG